MIVICNAGVLHVSHSQCGWLFHVFNSLLKQTVNFLEYHFRYFVIFDYVEYFYEESSLHRTNFVWMCEKIDNTSKLYYNCWELDRSLVVAYKLWSLSKPQNALSCNCQRFVLWRYQLLILGKSKITVWNVQLFKMKIRIDVSGWDFTNYRVT